MFGGESIYTNDIKDWLSQFSHHHILVEYGPTEATVATSWLVVHKNNINNFKNTIPIGRPAFNSRLYILDKNLQPVPIQMAELYIGGDGVARGYLNRPEVTAEKFIQNPFSSDINDRLYKTGDLCRYLADGNIEFIAELTIKLKFADLELRLMKFKIVWHHIQQLNKRSLLHKIITQIRQEKSGSLPILFLKNIATFPSIDELHQYMQHRLPDYMVPAFYVMVETFPLSPNGKLDRRALPEPKPDIITAILNHAVN